MLCPSFPLKIVKNSSSIFRWANLSTESHAKMFIFYIFETNSCKDTEVIAEECFAKRDQPKLNSLDVEEKKSNLYT